MTVRCKMQLTHKTEICWGACELTFHAIYDQTIEEDRRFAKASPSGQFKIMIDNPAALAQFELGKFYYFDAIPVPAQ
jgi:hypothetical protein